MCSGSWSLIISMQIDRGAKVNDCQDGLQFNDVLSDLVSPAFILVNDQRTIEALNPEAEHLLRLRAAAVLQQSSELLPRALQDLIEETLVTGRSLADRVIAPFSSGQVESLLKASTTAIRKPTGEVSAVAVLLTDFSLARQWEQNLQRLDLLASIGTLSAGVAHEIKNALVAVRTFLEILFKGNREMELTDIASREFQRIDSLVSQMLRFAGTATSDFSPVSVTEILENTIRLIEHQIENNKIALVRSFNVSPDTVRGDAHQLQQAFLNLLLNAVESMESGGQLSLSTELISSPSPGPDAPPSRGMLQVTIRDTGPGIPRENLGRLFEPFFTTKPNGTGLGLPITRRIIHDHEGTLRVESELDRGTAFHTLFPMAPDLNEVAGPRRILPLPQE